MKERQLLLAVRGIVEGVDVQRQMRRRLVERGDELVEQHVLQAEETIRRPMAFSNRESVGWLARSSSSIERPQISLKIGSLRNTSWSFWSA